MKDLEEYKQWLTCLVFNLKDEEFMHQVDSYGFPKDLLVSIPNSPYGNFPIFGITQCWESSLGEVKEWEETVRGTIQARIDSNNQIKEYFVSEQNVIMHPLDYYNSKVDFFRDEKNASYDDVFWADKNSVMANHKEIDAELFSAVNRFDFEKVKTLLQLDANPYETFDELDGDDCFERIEAECSFLANELNIAWRDQDMPINVSSLSDLYGSAAHEEMYKLLNQFAK